MRGLVRRPGSGGSTEPALGRSAAWVRSSRACANVATVMVWRRIEHLPLIALFGAVGVLHFARPQFFLPLMPTWLPWHPELVALSGVAELTTALALAVPAWRRWGGWLAFATLLAVWPANWHHALSGGISHPDLPPAMANTAVAWARLPLQLPLLWWAWTIARRRTSALGLGARHSGGVAAPREVVDERVAVEDGV